MSLNGISLNGGTWNGISLNGGNLNGGNLNGIVLNGLSTNAIGSHGEQIIHGIRIANGVGYNGLPVSGVVVNSTVYSFGNNGTFIHGYFVNNNGSANSTWDQIIPSLTLSGIVLDERIASKLTTVNVTSGSFLLNSASINTPSKFKGAILKGGTFVSHVWAEGSSLVTQVNGTYVKGTSWKDSILLFSAVLFSNESLIVEYLYGVIVQNVIVDTTFPDLFSYNFTGLDGTPYCSEGLATIIPDAFWDGKNGDRVQKEGLFTIACAGGALYKCSALLKYRPYANHGVSLANYHQACVRMMRADYCGSGVSHTINGKVIDVWDALNPAINYKENSTWTTEAYWGPSGALCFNAPRIPGSFGGWCGTQLPSCSPFSPNSFVANSFPPHTH